LCGEQASQLDVHPKLADVRYEDGKNLLHDTTPPLRATEKPGVKEKWD
jgi:hypothetical protein